jgi:hypothetical protein
MERTCRKRKSGMSESTGVPFATGGGGSLPGAGGAARPR